VVRRPTGGRAVLHDRELTYAIAIPAVHPLLIMGRSAILRDIGSAFVAAGRMIGLQAKLFRSGSRLANHESSRRGNPLCFEAISRWEVHLNGRKWIGSAQRFLPEAFLQHGSILIGKNTHDIAEMLDVHSQAKTSDNFQINEQDLRRTIPKAIAERWNLIWRDEGFTAEELAQMEVT
jgi:lipoate-protein ligase A